jgi:hypothetical protein
MHLHFADEVLHAGEDSETMPAADPPIPSEQQPQPRPVGD